MPASATTFTVCRDDESGLALPELLASPRRARTTLRNRIVRRTVAAAGPDLPEARFRVILRPEGGMPMRVTARHAA